MRTAPPRRRRSAARQREPLEPEVAYRGLVAATILRALRDLRLPAWRYDAQWWLAGEGREWGELIDVDVSKLDRECKNTKGQGKNGNHLERSS